MSCCKSTSTFLLSEVRPLCPFNGMLQPRREWRFRICCPQQIVAFDQGWTQHVRRAGCPVLDGSNLYQPGCAPLETTTGGDPRFWLVYSIKRQESMGSNKRLHLFTCSWDATCSVTVDHSPRSLSVRPERSVLTCVSTPWRGWHVHRTACLLCLDSILEFATAEVGVQRPPRRMHQEPKLPTTAVAHSALAAFTGRNFGQTTLTSTTIAKGTRHSRPPEGLLRQNDGSAYLLSSTAVKSMHSPACFISHVFWPVEEQNVSRLDANRQNHQKTDSLNIKWVRTTVPWNPCVSLLLLRTKGQGGFLGNGFCMHSSYPTQQ